MVRLFDSLLTYFTLLELFNNKGCLQPYDVLEGCLSEFYYSVNYFMHQDSGSKLFCE